VIVPKPKNDSLVAQLESLYRTFLDISPGEKVNFDLSLLDWAYPLLILPISAYINNTKSDYVISNSPIKSHLERVNFPQGVDSVSLFQKHIQRNKKYIPITVLKRGVGASKEELEALFIEKIYGVLGNVSGARSALFYPITELATNIFDHSKKDMGFIFSQFYPSKNYLDICIVDCGRGFAATYKEERGLELSDANAISEAMKGNSVKPEKERGYGIWTSKKIVCEVLGGGGFILISGSAGLAAMNKKEKLISFPYPRFYWQGAIIAYRIKKPSGPLDISPFIE